MENTLLNFSANPNYNAIKVEDIEPAIDKILRSNRETINGLLNNNLPFTWDNLVQPMEEMSDNLHRLWGPVSLLSAVKDNPELRQAKNACLPRLTQYYTEIGQNQKLYQAYLQIKSSASFEMLSKAQQKIVTDAIRDFKLSGVALAPEDKQKFLEIEDKLQQLTTKFSENVLDATDDWKLHITSEKDLQGIPEAAVKEAKQNAKNKSVDGWLFSLEYPSFNAVITYADNRKMREKIYKAYVTRASGLSESGDKYDNSEIIEKILKLRQQQAKLLEFNNYAEYSLATKMARTPKQVLDFLKELALHSIQPAQQEFQQLQQFAKEKFGFADLQAYDVAYYSEKMKQELFSISDEKLRQYFPLNKVLEGLFTIVNNLYGIKLKQLEAQNLWHPTVISYAVYGKEEKLKGKLYMDLYARSHKRGGAWMDDICSRMRKKEEGLQLPEAYLACNFRRAEDNKPALLSHEEVVTLFHEFGHCLHHLLTTIDYMSASGINGVEWDAVELPSQFMENWCWQPQSLQMISAHVDTGEPLPAELLDKLQQMKNFQAGMQMVRQLEFSLFDFVLHLEYEGKTNQVQDIMDEIRNEVAVIKPPIYNRMQNSFSHIFAGGYAAGYYSYKWAEVLASDAFEKFETNGIFDKKTGEGFLQSILERGGSEPALDLFVDFRGREPKIDALLRHSGIKN